MTLEKEVYQDIRSYFNLAYDERNSDVICAKLDAYYRKRKATEPARISGDVKIDVNPDIVDESSLDPEVKMRHIAAKVCRQYGIRISQLKNLKGDGTRGRGTSEIIAAREAFCKQCIACNISNLGSRKIGKYLGVDRSMVSYYTNDGRRLDMRRRYRRAKLNNTKPITNDSQLKNVA